MQEWVLKKRGILFHIIITYFTCGIWAIIYFYYKFKQKDKEESYEEHLNNYIPTGNKKLNDYYRIEKEYSPILKQHYDNIEKINMMYTVANNLALPNSKEMQQVTDLCLQDIKLAPQILNYCKELANNYDDDNLERYLVSYPSFKRLAIIYEKQGNFKKAIDICKQAIELGFYKDGTPGQMPGRLARLIKKSNQQKTQIENK